MNDFISVEGAGRNVSGCDPAGYTGTFQSFTDRLRDGAVRRGVADEYVVRAGFSVSCLPFAAAFSHVDPPDICTMLADKPRVYQSQPGIPGRWGRTWPLEQAECAEERPGLAGARCCAGYQPFRMKKANALKMEHFSHRKNLEARVSSKMGFG